MLDLKENTNKLLYFINEDVMKDYDDILDMSKQYKTDADILSEINEELSNKISQILLSTEEIARGMESTSVVIEQATSGSQEIAKGSELAAGIAVNINEVSMEMTAKAQELSDLVHQFKI